MKLSLATLALTASTALAAPAPEAKKGVDPALCSFSNQEFFQQAACAGEWWAKKMESRCNIKVRCGGDAYSSTFGIADKRDVADNPGGIMGFLDCSSLGALVRAWADALRGKPNDPDVFGKWWDATNLYNTYCVESNGPIVGPITPEPTVPGGPMTPDPTRSGGPIVPDRPVEGGAITPDKGSAGGPIKPST